MRPFPASTELLLKKNIGGNSGCLPVPTSYSLENSVARLRFAVVLRTKFLLRPTRNVRVLGRGVPSEQFLADHTPAHTPLDSDADSGSHQWLSSSPRPGGNWHASLPNISLQNQTFFPVGSCTLRSDASAVRGERSVGTWCPPRAPALLHEFLDGRILVSVSLVYGESGKIVQKVRAQLPKITLRLPSKTGRFFHILRILHLEASGPC
jgi:hypothetical protein